MRFSSSFKVGILTLIAIIILVFTVLWVKGRTFSAGQRISVEFRDINGMRAGSGVQMMGVRIGQVEELIPKISGEDSGVIVKFVITEPDIKIPTASSISIQQSGLIGEQFLEITPPQVKNIYIPISNKSKILHIKDKVQMLLSKKYYDVGEIKKIEIIETNTIPITQSQNIKTKLAYKVGYIINLPGLILPDTLTGRIVLDEDFEKLRLIPREGVEVLYPHTDSEYTVIEPMRLSDFMELQYRAAESLATTNDKISVLLSDDVIHDLQVSAATLTDLTKNANTTFEKANVLIDTSKEELLTLSKNTNGLAVKLTDLTNNLNKYAEDKDFMANVASTTKSINRLSSNLNKILEDPTTKSTINNLNVTSKNIAELSSYVNDMTKDPVLKANINNSVIKLNSALDKLTVTLETVNYATCDKQQLRETLSDVNATTENLKKFSEKLNKRFLLFRLMF